MTSITKRKVAELAAQGMKQEEIATILKTTPSYISQIVSDDGYQALLAEITAAQRLGKHAIYSEIDNNYDHLELELTRVMKAQAHEIAQMAAGKFSDLMNYVRTLNGVKRRASGEQGNLPTHGQKVIELPTFLLRAEDKVPEVQHNSSNEIIEVDGKSMISITNDNLRTMAKEKAEAASRLKLPATKPEDLDLTPVTG